jgi:hypothetical protein
MNAVAGFVEPAGAHRRKSERHPDAAFEHPGDMARLRARSRIATPVLRQPQQVLPDREIMLAGGSERHRFRMLEINIDAFRNGDGLQPRLDEADQPIAI